MKEKVAIRLRELRLERGLTLEEVAQKTGLRNQYISNYERGLRQADYATIITLAELYEVSVDYLLGRDVPRYPTLVERTFSFLKDDPKLMQDVAGLARDYKDMNPEDRSTTNNLISSLAEKARKENGNS